MSGKDEHTTLYQLKKKVDKLLEERPSLSDARVLIDTEARVFNVHMVDVTDIYAESDEIFDALGMGKYITLTPDYSLTEHSINKIDEDEEEFDEDRLTVAQLELLDIKINDLLNRSDEAEADYVKYQLKQILRD